MKIINKFSAPNHHHHHPKFVLIYNMMSNLLGNSIQTECFRHFLPILSITQVCLKIIYNIGWNKLTAWKVYDKLIYYYDLNIFIRAEFWIRKSIYDWGHFLAVKELCQSNKPRFITVLLLHHLIIEFHSISFSTNSGQLTLFRCHEHCKCVNIYIRIDDAFNWLVLLPKIFPAHIEAFAMK